MARSSYPPSPSFFYRITDSTSYFAYDKSARKGASDLNSAFSCDGAWACWKYGPLHKNLTAAMILSQIDGSAPVHGGEWAWFIGMYENEDVVRKEVDRRRVMGRRDIKTWRIDGSHMNWQKEKLKREKGEEVEIDVLLSWEADACEPVLFVSVAELVSKLGLNDRLGGADVDGEWLALEWIPMEWVVPWQTFS